MKGSILLAIGYLISLSLVFCVVLIVRKHTALRGARQCEGTVTGYESRAGGKGSSTYALRITYLDQAGVQRTFATSGSSSPAARAIGDRVLVFEHAGATRPDALVFETLYLGFWIWLCVGGCVAGCVLAPRLLHWIYVR